MRRLDERHLHILSVAQASHDGGRGLGLLCLVFSKDVDQHEKELAVDNRSLEEQDKT